MGARDVATVHTLVMLAMTPLLLVVLVGGVTWLGLRWGSGGARVLQDIVVASCLYACGLNFVGIFVARWFDVPLFMRELIAWLSETPPPPKKVLQVATFAKADKSMKSDNFSSGSPTSAIHRDVWDIAEQSMVALEAVCEALRSGARCCELPQERMRACAIPWALAGAVTAAEVAAFAAVNAAQLFGASLVVAIGAVLTTGWAAHCVAPRGDGLDIPHAASTLESILAIAGRSPVFVALGCVVLSGFLPVYEAQMQSLALWAENRLADAQGALAEVLQVERTLFAKMMRATTPSALFEKTIAGPTWTESADSLQALSANASDHAKVLAMSGVRLLPSVVRPESEAAQLRVRTVAGGLGNILGGIASKFTAIAGLASPTPPQSLSGASASANMADLPLAPAPMRQVMRGVKELSTGMLVCRDLGGAESEHSTDDEAVEADATPVLERPALMNTTS